MSSQQKYGEASAHVLTDALHDWVSSLEQRQWQDADRHVAQIVGALDSVGKSLENACDRAEGMPIQNLVAEILRTLQAVIQAEMS